MFSANHVELLAPFWPAITSMIHQGKIDAAAYNCTGLHLPGHIAPTALVNSGDMGQHSNAAYAALHFVNHWHHTHDELFFMQTAYTFLREVAEWWSCWLVRNETTGIFNDVQDCTREDCSALLNDPVSANLNPAISVAFVKRILACLIATAHVSAAPQSMVARWREMHAHLPPLPTGLFSGKTVLLPQQEPYHFMPGDNDLPVYGVYPGEQIGISSPKPLRQAAIDTILLLNSWTQMNSWPTLFPAAVRAGLPFSVVKSRLEAGIRAYMPPSGYLSVGGGGIEGAGGLLAVNEMLLQSWDGVLRLFPVWSGKDASFHHLRAVGAFVVSASLKSGIVTGFSIISEAGGACLLESPWDGAKPEVRNRVGQLVRVTTVDGARGEFMFETEVKGVYKVQSANASDDASGATGGKVDE